MIIKRELLYSFLLTLLCVGIFGQVRNFDFIIHDDPIYIYQNPHIRYGISAEGIRWAFSADLIKDYAEADYWRPLTFISHMIDAELFGMNPSGHHIMNLGFHILNVLLLFFFLRQITNRSGESFLVASLFAIHPLQVQTVAWVTARKDLLSACFGLITLSFYTSWVQNRESKEFKIFSVISFALGLMTKPVLIVLPVIMIILDNWILKRRKEMRELLAEKIPYLFLSLILLVIMLFGKSGVSIDVPIDLRIANILFNLKEYVFHFIWPINLSIYSPINKTTVSAINAAVIILMSVAASYQFWQWRHRMPYWLVGWCWFLIFIAPSISLTRADRFMYVPIIGLSIASVYGVNEWFERIRFQSRLKFFTGLIVITALIPISFQNASLWKNGKTLFTSVIQKNPNHHRAHFILAQILADQKSYGQAIAHFEKALDGSPKDSGIYNEIGLNDMKLGKMKAAARNFFQASRAYPKPAILSINYNNLGLVYQQKEKWGIARVYFHKSIRANPEYPQPYYNLAQIAFIFGKEELAIDRLNQAIHANPYFEDARIELGSLLASRGKPDEAIEQFRFILKYNSRSVKALNNLGGILLQIGKVGEAKTYFERALRFESNYEPAKKNLAIIEHALETYRDQLTQNK